RSAVPPTPSQVQKKTSDDDLNSEPGTPSPQALSFDDQSATSAWRQTLAEIGDMTADFAARAERVAISGPNRLVVSFRKAYTQAQQYCERPERRKKLEQTLSKIAGCNIRLDIATLPEESPAAAGSERTAPKHPVNRRQR